MFIDVCPSCGKYRTYQTVKTQGDSSYVVCAQCGGQYPFKRLPLILAVGPSGAGKTSLCMEMGRVTQEVVGLDGDILLREELLTHGYEGFREIWLALAANIAQSGRPPLLFMGGTPGDFDGLDRLKYFNPIHFIGICADGPDIIARLKARPDWRASHGAEFIADMLKINNAVRGLPNVINTSGKTARNTAWELASMTHRLLSGE